MFGFGSKKKQEEEMAEWLAQAEGFGQRPKSVKHLRTFKGKMLGVDAPLEIFLMEFVMPNDSKGRGFVNGAQTWVFHEEVWGISDEDLAVAYCGWAWLTFQLQSGAAVTAFEPNGEDETAYLAQKTEEGFTDLEVAARYKLGQNEIFELRGTHSGEPARAAGNTEMDTSIVAGDPCYNLPAVYFLLGAQVAPTLH